MSGMLSLRVVLQFSAKDPPTIRDIQLDFREKEAVDPIDHVSVVLAEAPGESRAEAEFNLLQLLLNRTKSGYPSDRALFAFVAKMFAR